jgi:glucokinase
MIAHPNAFESYIGVDVGGSNVFGVLYDSNDQILQEIKIDTESRSGYQNVLSRIRGLIDSLEAASVASGYALKGIGLGVPGIVSVLDNTIISAPNLGWKNTDLLKDLGLNNRRDIRVVLVNDVNAGLIGELAHFLAPPSIAVAYFCGTGIGGAIAVHGHLLQGFGGGAGEVGHMVVEIDGRRCGCGKQGCLEAYIGKWALNEMIENAIANGRTALEDIIEYDLRKKPVKSSSLKEAYEKHDPFTVNLMEDYYCRYLATGISQAVHLLNPEIIILGGGIMEAMGQRLLPHLFHQLQSLILSLPPRLVLAESGDYAGPLGAARLLRME